MVLLQCEAYHRVDICSPDAERLNPLITDYLNNSREKSYEFAEADLSELLDETLTLLERHPQWQGKYRIERVFAARPVRVRADSNRIKQVFWNLCDNALRAMPAGGTLTVKLETAPFWVLIHIRDT